MIASDELLHFLVPALPETATVYTPSWVGGVQRVAQAKCAVANLKSAPAAPSLTVVFSGLAGAIATASIDSSIGVRPGIT